jgi:hypothetical protein
MAKAMEMKIIMTWIFILIAVIVCILIIRMLTKEGFSIVDAIGNFW